MRVFYARDLADRVQMTAGVSWRCLTDASRVIFRVDQLPNDRAGGWDALVNNALWKRLPLQDGENRFLDLGDLPPGEKELELFFPVSRHIILRSVEADAPLFPAPQRSRWIAYGSSITHGRQAAGPAFTYPAIVARELGWDAWNLGFAGECKLDPVVARVMAGMPADRISCCLGINTCEGLYSLRTWIPAVEGFLLALRDGHPVTPLLVISPILSPPREVMDAGPTVIDLQTMRKTLEAIVQKFRERGDDRIHYLDGLSLIGPGDEHLLPDELHPYPEGISILAQRFMEKAPADWLNATSPSVADPGLGMINR